MISQEGELKAINSPVNNKNSQQYFRSSLKHMAMRKIVKLKRKWGNKPNTLENIDAPSCRLLIQSMTWNNSLQSTFSDVQMPKSIHFFPHFESSHWCYTVASRVSWKGWSDLESSRIWKPKESL